MYVVINQELLDQKRYELSTERQRGAVADVHKIEALEQEIAQLENNKVEENNEAIAYFLDELTVDDGDGKVYNMRDLVGSEPAYQILRLAIQQGMMQREEGRIAETNKAQEAAAAQVVQLKAEKEEIHNRYDAMYEEAASLRNEVNTLRNEVNTLQEAKADLEHKRDAAAAELESANKEIERLNSQVDDLRTEIAVGAKNAVRVIDVGPDMNEMMERFKEQKKKEEENKPAIYNVNPLDNRRSRFSAQYAETDEYFEDYYMYIGKYREVQPEEAITFRAAAEEKRRNEDLARARAELEASLTPPSLQFQEETDLAEHGLDQADADGEVEGQATTAIEERLTALEQRVSILEQQRLGEAA
ncbi:hypothetical protein SAMN05518848_104203 [Paenibacillus sp. PDC88]|nr:hypothetical protein SAMN05518848_104203 [Paenibacillus sp. PDC88]